MVIFGCGGYSLSFRDYIHLNGIIIPSELGVHFTECGLEQLELQIIDCVKVGMDMALIQLEGVWQTRLATFQVHGNINIRNELR